MHLLFFYFLSKRRRDVVEGPRFCRHEFEAPTYPMDYHEACVDEVAEDDRAGLGARREQIGVVEGWFDGVPEYFSASFVFNAEGEARLI